MAASFFGQRRSSRLRKQFERHHGRSLPRARRVQGGEGRCGGVVRWAVGEYACAFWKRGRGVAFQSAKSSAHEPS